MKRGAPENVPRRPKGRKDELDAYASVSVETSFCLLHIFTNGR